VDQKGYNTCWWSWVKTEGRGLSVDENWHTGDNMSVGRIPLHDITTIISVASKTFKNAHLWKCVIVYEKATRMKNNKLVSKAKLSYTCSNSTSLPIPHHWNKARVNTPSVQTFPAHTYAQQFLSANVSNRPAQCQISWPATARKQQRDSPCLVLVPFKHEPSKSECR
jgi:hypothetical protein